MPLEKVTVGARFRRAVVEHFGDAANAAIHAIVWKARHNWPDIWEHLETERDTGEELWPAKMPMMGRLYGVAMNVDGDAGELVSFVPLPGDPSEF